MLVKFMPRQSILILLLVGIAVFHLSAFSAENDGGSRQPAVAVSIKFDGEPLANGRVFFHLPKDQFLGGKIESGKCRLDCVPAGIYRVTIESKGLPRKYSSVEQTGLMVQVVPGNNDFVFALLSD